MGQCLDGRFVLGPVIGEGRCTRIYRARQEATGREVAIKLLREPLLLDPPEVHRLQREAWAACAVSHPAVATVHDFCFTPGAHCYLVMELLAGETVGAVLLRDGHLPLSRAITLFREMALGLAAAHQQGVVHGDLHPGHLILGRGDLGAERVRIIGFSGAGPAEEAPAGEGEGSERQALMRLNELLARVRYLSPEQLHQRVPDPRSDVYALGLMLFELCTGVPPFIDADPVQVMAMQLRDPPPPLPLLPALQELLDAMLAKDPQQRPGDAGEVVQRLLTLLEWDVLHGEGQLLPTRLGHHRVPRPVAPVEEANPALSTLPARPERTMDTNVDICPAGLAEVRAVAPEPASMRQDLQPPMRRRRPWVVALCLLATMVLASVGGHAYRTRRARAMPMVTIRHPELMVPAHPPESEPAPAPLQQ